VPESSAKFAVLGWVNMPGFFPLPDGQHVTLSSAVSMAKGMDNRRAGISQVAVLRTVNGKQERMVFNLNKFSKRGDYRRIRKFKPATSFLCLKPAKSIGIEQWVYSAVRQISPG